MKNSDIKAGLRKASWIDLEGTVLIGNDHYIGDPKTLTHLKSCKLTII
jgi:hypothetical protein